MVRLNVQRADGLSLAELMVATSVILVAVLATTGYRYYASMDTRKAEVQINAARLTQSILECWKGAGGRPDFDPETKLGSMLLISACSDGPATPVGFNQLGSYNIFFLSVLEASK